MRLGEPLYWDVTAKRVLDLIASAKRERNRSGL